MEKEDVSLYTTLGIDVTKHDVLMLSEKDIASAYRKAALKWHPDKNRGDSSAAEKFSQIFLAYETLSSPTKRKEYDDRIRQLRHRRKAWMQMDATRRKMRQQLQQREIQAAQPAPRSSQKHFVYEMDDNALARVQREIERLRKEAMQENTPASTGKTQTRKTDSNKHEVDVGSWSKVPNFYNFKSKSASVSFEHFEQAILKGYAPF